MRIITVSREFGSGGREVAKRLSDALHIAYYDQEIISAIAKEASLDEKYVEHTLESGVGMQFPITFSHTFATFPVINAAGPQLLAAQHKIIRELADGGDCIIVGRCADVVLEELEPFRLFVYADAKSKLARCKARALPGEQMTDKEFLRRMRQIDKGRADNHNLVASNYRWGDKEGYELCLNTTDIELKTLIPMVAAYIDQWFVDKGR